MGKDMFGGLFDLNKDGKLSPEEQALEFEFLQRLANESGQNAEVDDDGVDGGVSITITVGGDDTDEEEDWRDEFYGNELEIDPDDYDSQEEFLEACADKNRWLCGMSEKIRALAKEYDVAPLDYDNFEEFLDALSIEME